MPDTPEQMLREFHETAGLTLPAGPTLDIGSQFVSDEVREKMLDSEVDELKDAVAAGDLEGIADALADIVYVAVGTAVTYGLPFDALLAEIHRSNMTKFLPDGPVIDSDGKIVKGAGYEPPDIGRVLADQPVPRTPAEPERNTAIRIARAFHEAYERLAPQVGYETRAESAVPWDDVPIANRTLMANVAAELLQRGVITAADPPSPEPQPAPPLPPGIYGRVELPGFRSCTGWMTEGMLAGQPVMVFTGRGGEALGEYVMGPASRFVRLQVPETTATAEPLAITAGGWDHDEFGPYPGDDREPF